MMLVVFYAKHVNYHFYVLETIAKVPYFVKLYNNSTIWYRDN
jgi:hypothetical protein